MDSEDSSKIKLLDDEEDVMEEEFDRVICTKCFKNYNEIDRLPILLPCREGHPICSVCLGQLVETPVSVEVGPAPPKTDPSSEESSSEKICWLIGRNCTNKLNHFECPICQDIFHIPENNPDLLIKMPQNQKDLDHLQEIIDETRKKLRQATNDVVMTGIETSNYLTELRKKIDKHAKNCRIANISGSAPAAAGGVIFIVGASLLFSTLGASFPLMIVGGVMSGVGGAAAAGAAITKLVIDKKARNEIKMRVEACLTLQTEWMKIFHQLKLLTDVFKDGLSYWDKSRYSANGAVKKLEKKDCYQVAATAVHVGSGAVSTVGIVRLAAVAADITEDVAGSAFRIVGTAGRAIHIVGLVGAAIMLPVDIVNVIWSSVELYKTEPTKLSKFIADVAGEIRFKCCIKPRVDTDELLMEVDDGDRETYV